MTNTDRVKQEKLEHNGDGTNLYCDGRLFFVTGCPACDKAYEKAMRPRWARAKTLSNELKAIGMSDLSYHADLWRVSAQGVLHGHQLKIEEVSA